VSSTTSSSPDGFFSSPRRQQLLLWASAVVLVAGIAVFLAVFLSRGSAQPASAGSTSPSPPAATTPATKPAKHPQPAGHAKAPSAALQVARTFLLTAVQRKNLDASYDLVGPNLKGRLTRAQWRKGNIAVTFYPARNARTTAFVVKQVSANHVMLQVELTPQKGSHVRPLAFWLGLDHVAGKNGKSAHWIVNYWLPDYSIPVKANPYNN
jgi:hypothetical protein